MKTCPRCGQSGLHHVKLTVLDNRTVNLCEECDALWDTPGEIKDPCAFEDFSQFMEARGQRGLWSNVQILD